MSQFSILGKFYVSMALILSLVSGFCEGRNVSEPSLNSFCPLNPLFPTSTHVEQNVTSCLESCTEFLCTSVFSSLSCFLGSFSQKQVNYARRIYLQLQQKLNQVSLAKRLTDLDCTNPRDLLTKLLLSFICFSFS